MNIEYIPSITGRISFLNRTLKKKYDFVNKFFHREFLECLQSKEYSTRQILYFKINYSKFHTLSTFLNVFDIDGCIQKKNDVVLNKIFVAVNLDFLQYPNNCLQK